MAFPFSRTFTSGSYQLTTTDLNVLCDTTTGTFKLTLPKISDVLFIRGRQGNPVGANGIFTINITDIGNNASVNQIDILQNGTDYFSGNVSVSITENSGSVSLKPISDNIWQVVYGNGVTGGGANNAVILLGAGTGSSYRCGNTNNANSNYGTVSGGTGNLDNGGCGHTISGGVFNTISGDYHNTISGGYFNTSSGKYQSVIGGGYSNTASANYATISGGTNNTASSNGATVSGGFANTSSSYYSTVSGGRVNTASCNYSTVGGGFSNTSSSYYSTVGGGFNNIASSDYGTVSGGRGNVSGIVGNINRYNGLTLNSFSGTVADNTYTVTPTSTSGVGSGGVFLITFVGNSITQIVTNFGGKEYNIGDTITISGSQFGGGSGDDVVLNVAQLTTNIFNALSGGRDNTAIECHSTVSGGYCNYAGNYSGTVSGGAKNVNLGYYGTISGGYENYIFAGITNIGSEGCNTISGGRGNQILNTKSAVVSGGEFNCVLESACCGVVAGGRNNIVKGAGCGSFIGSGLNNSITERFSVIGGGKQNLTNSSYSSLGGGICNCVIGTIGVVSGGGCNKATSIGSFVGGGCGNSSSGTYTAVLGGRNNSTGGCNFAMIIGDNISANDTCTTFVNKLSAINLPNGVGSVQQYGFYYDPLTCQVYYKP